MMAEGNQIQVFKIDWEVGPAKNPVVALTDLSYSRSLDIRSGEDFVIGYDNCTSTVLKIEADGRVLRQTVHLFFTAVCGFGQAVLFVIDYSDVFIAHVSDFPDQAQRLFSELEGIDRIVTDTTIGNLIILTKSGTIKVRSLLTNEVLGEMDLRGKIVKTILVTKLWHLIIVECDQTWQIATMCGKVIQQTQIFKQIAVAVTFAGPREEDYVAFVDRERVLHIVEVFHPENLQALGKIKGDALAINYVRPHQLVTAIDSAGVVTAFRFPAPADNAGAVFENNKNKR
jgi:hypothetical protein